MRHLVAVVGLACAVAGGARAADPLEIHDYAMMSVAVGLIGVDVWQSLDIKNQQPPTVRNSNFRYGAVESNPLVVALFGQNPTDGQFLALGLMSSAAVVTGWYYMPERYRWLMPAAVIIVEGATVYRSARMGMRLQF